jgi:flagellar basal body-associated protein FliL
MLKVIVLVMALLLLGGGGFLTWSKLRAADDGAEQATEESGEEAAHAATRTLPLGEFLVNLRSSDGTLRYLQTEIAVVVDAPQEHSADSGDHGHGGPDDEEPQLPPASHRYARDVAIEVLSSQSFDRLREQSDRTRLKATLQQKLDAALQSHEVRDVLFTAFVMQ